MKRALSLLLVLGLTLAVVGCNRLDNADDNGSSSSVDYTSKGLGPVETLHSEEAFRNFIESHEIAVVKFGASWCRPCVLLAPELQHMSGYFAENNVGFAEIDVDALSSLANAQGIGGVPDVRIFYQGRLYTHIIGCLPNEIASAINSMVANVQTPAPQEVDDATDEVEDEIVFDPPAAAFATSDVDDPNSVDPKELSVLVTYDEYKEFISSNPVAVVKAGATWCPPCRELAPKMPYIAASFPNVAFAAVDVDNSKEIVRELNIRSIPYVAIFVNGRLVESVLGNSPDEIRQMVQKHADPQEPVAEEPVAEEPVAEEPVAEEPVAEEPVAEEPVAEEPVVEEPVVEEPVVEEPVVEEPVVEEPVAEEPVAEEPVVEEPVVEEPAVEDDITVDDAPELP